MISDITLGVIFAVFMEPAAAVLHRWVMHGFGWGWHRSHHQSTKGSWIEKNDRYPLVFAFITFVIMAMATWAGNAAVISAAVGITAYGIAYLGVHDLCIHGRAGALPAPMERLRYISWVREAHRVHHLYSKAPYGFLFPMVPASLRITAESVDHDPLRRREHATSIGQR